jgi:BirA family biotin operon repressor/biotin-[acetyl-CoA-carboxylase] ligase
MARVAPHKTTNARALRNAATAEERLLWTRLRHVRPRFTRQLAIGSYILDFACRTAKIVVELDGSQHLDSTVYDEQRTAFLAGLGWQVLRFWNNDVRDNPDGVAEAIVAALVLRLRLTHPQPLPFREGS